MSRKLKKNLFKLRFFLLAAPSIAGVFLFFVYPYIKMLYYSMQKSNFELEFAGLSHYISVFKNSLFQMALRNSLLFAAGATAAAVVLSLIITLLLLSLPKKLYWLRYSFLFPILAPSVGIILVWRVIFGDTNLVNALIKGIDNGFLAVLPIFALFLWKNMGYCVILLAAAVARLPKSVGEAAELDGASGIKKHFYITVPLISPTLFFTVILMLMFSLRIFRESYLYFQTDYPPDAVYTVPYFINNHFNRLDYQRLSAAAVIFSLFILVIISAGYCIDKILSRAAGGDEQ